MDDYSVIRPLVAGWLSGLIEVSLTHPVDVIKTRMQIDKKNILPTMSTIVKERSFYQGFKFRILGIGPMRMTFWGSMKLIDSHLQQYKLSKMCHMILVGVGGAICQTLIDAPIELLKTRMIGQPIISNTCSTIYRGFIPTVVRNAGFAAILQNVICFGRSRLDGVTSNTYICNLAIPGVAGAVASILTQPIDNIKTIYQKSTTTSLSQAIIEVGKGNWMRGTVPRATMGFLNMSVGYFAFNFFYKF